MHIQLQQGGFLLRNIKIYGICTTFRLKKCEKRKPNTCSWRRRKSCPSQCLTMFRG